jgi:hypothetical protein
VLDGVIGHLAPEQPIDIGQAQNAGSGEEFGHEVVMGSGCQKPVLSTPEFTPLPWCHVAGQNMEVRIPDGQQVDPIWAMNPVS